MDEFETRIAVSERILNDLRSIVKQIYYDSVNDELNHENRTYLCMRLIKNLDEALSHGLKQLHLGYWKAVKSVLHPESLSQIEKLPKFNGLECNNFNRGRSWIAIALREDCFVNYVQCIVKESSINKYYEKWSLIRNNDTCNKFLSVLSGINNISFVFNIDYVNKPPSHCNFSTKVMKEEEDKNLSTSKCSINLTTSSSSLTSPVDSGCHIQDSSSDVEQLPEDKPADIDFLNGNVPETVMRRKNKKDTKRHVSFHEDIIYKSPDKCRKLKWDCENLRYSWAGEEIDSSLLGKTDFSEIKLQMTPNNPVLDINERGAPEGEETPCSEENLKHISKTHKSIIVKRFLQSINKQSKIKQLSKKYSNVAPPYQFYKIKMDKSLISEINQEIRLECERHWRNVTSSRHEVPLRTNVIKQMIKHESIYKSYQLREHLFIITNASIYLVSKTLETRKIPLESVTDVVISPESHVFWLRDSKSKLQKFVTGSEELTHELMGRLELCMRRNRFELPQFRILNHGDLTTLKRQLISRCVVEKSENLVYCGLIRLEREVEPWEARGATSKRGFLMYRDRRGGDAWMPGDFWLRGPILYLYVDGLVQPKFAINLSSTCQSCSRTTDSGRPHTFQITIMEEEVDFQNDENCFYEDKYLKSQLLKSETHKLLSEIRHKVNQLLSFGSKNDKACVLEFAAANEYELSEWLQIIIQASCGDSGEDACKETILDGALILTANSLIITNEIFSDTEIEILSSAQIGEVAGFRIGKDDRDLFILIEFSCMEATSISGDWIVYFSSRAELEKLSCVLKRLWCFSTKYPGSYMTDERLINRCRKTQANLDSQYWTQLIR